MVLVDIFVPAVDKTYNFNLNEGVAVENVILEITEMIEQKERTTLVGNRTALNLYNERDNVVLPKTNTLEECYVTSGTKFLMV
ncbi:MAG: glutamyl-tRNA amidotransferase [Butyrivibrio sp.]|nr:glutamyl-tRNA amidotransferase [Butyrivibrio sp.]